MGIAKEIFGLERIDRVYEDVNQYNFGVDDGINKTIDKIDAFEISEEAIAKIVYPHLAVMSVGLAFVSNLPWSEDKQKLLKQINKEIAKSIKANANKIFVRRENEIN